MSIFTIGGFIQLQGSILICILGGFCGIPVSVLYGIIEFQFGRVCGVDGIRVGFSVIGIYIAIYAGRAYFL